MRKKFLYLLIIFFIPLTSYSFKSLNKDFIIDLPQDLNGEKVIKFLNNELRIDFSLDEYNFTHELLKKLFIETVDTYDNQEIIKSVKFEKNYSKVLIDFSYRKNGSSKIEHTEVAQNLKIIKGSESVKIILQNSFNQLTKIFINLYVNATNQDKIIPDSVSCTIMKYGNGVKVNLGFRVYGSPSNARIESEIDEYFSGILNTANDLIFPLARD